MTGWRLGYGIMPVAVAQRVELLLTHSIGATAHFTQYAGLEALCAAQDAVDAMVTEFQRRREVMVSGLNELPGFRCRTPQGAFYAFPNIRETGLSSAELAELLLEKAGVALLPGSAFGQFGEGYLRLSYANSVEKIKEGLARIRELLT
jgi:aspartate/methionine/tyrosine aminotransferase